MKKKGNIQLIDAKQLIKTLLVLLIVSITLGTVNTNPQLISTAGNYEKVALDEVKKDLKLEVTPIRGGVILNSDDTVYEGEYIKYNIKVSNTTDEEMKNVKVVATIPDGLTSAELKSNFNEVRQPYYYELKEAIAKTTINVGNLEAGESKEGYFEVKVDALGEQETKVVETSISSYVGTELIETKNITNKIEPAEVNLFMGSFIEYGGIHYGINVKSETQEEVEVKIHFPKCFSLKSISKQESDVEEFDKIESIYGGGIVIYLSDDFNGGNTLNNIDVETSENNVVTVKLQANKNYMFFGLINGTLIERDPNSTEETILAYAQTSDGKYMSNENRIKYLLQAVEVTMSSPNENDKLKFEDDIEYEITVNNIGGSRVESVADNDYVKVTLTDFLPENIKATEVIYDNWEEIFEEQVNGDNETISILKELNKVQKTEDISKTKTDNDGNKLPNISLELNIPKGEKAIIKIKAKAGMVYEETQIENMAKVVGDEIVETVSNKVSHIIHAYNYVESTQPDTPDTPENPDTPSNPGEPVKPGVTDPSNNGGGTINNNNQTEINASKNCDFKIDKYVSKITVTTINGTTAKDYNNEKLAKVEIRSKEINGSTVIIEYKLLIENIGGVAATLDGVKDYLPEGLTFSSQLNKNWAQNSDGSIFYAGNSKYIMQPGENIELTLIATKQMKSNTTGIFTNKAELGTVVGTGNKKDADMSNNSSEAQVIIGISTGAYTYITFVTIVLGILVIGAIILYKKGKINTKKIKKATFMLVFIITLLSTQVVQLGETEYKARDPKDFNSPLMGYYWEKSFEFQSPWNGDINDPTIYYYWYKGPTGYALCANDKIVMTMEGCSAYPVFTYNFAGHNYLGRTPRSYIGTDGILSLSKANEDSIPAIYNDGNIIYGPFAYNSENAERFSISILDNNGKRIDNWSLLDENKNGIGFDGLKNGQNKMFYLKFNAKLCENGISSIKLYANGTETRKYKRKDKYEAYYTNGDYQPIYVPELWTDEYEEKEYIKVNKEIEWTVFNGNIQILKKDPDSGKLLEGVGFKIKNSEGKWIIAVDENGTQKTVIGSVQLTELKYTDNKEEATEFITDSTGYVKIYNVIVGEYIIEEVSIGDNVFYGVDEKYISWDDGNGNTGNGNGAIITPANQTSYDYEGTGKNTMTIFNKQKYVDISGIVWEDIISGKDSTRNSLYKNDEYDVNDKEVANVTVRLLDSKGNEVQQSVLTDENGKYSFKKLEIDKLKEYYVQFTYNGMSYESVITNIEAENGSKANEGSERKTFNDKFDKIENNIAISVNSETTKLKYEKDEYISTLLYEGDNDVYGYDGAKFPINFTAEKYLITSNTYDGCGGYLDKIKSPETIRKEGITEVTGINQGIYEREQPDLFVTNDIMNTKISIKGYEHIYQYANRFNHRNEIVSDASVEGVGVKFGNKYTQTYLQPIYRADINYESEKNDEFKLYLTYVAALTNQSTTLTSKVNSIVNYYDTDYEVIAVGTEINEKGEISNELSYKKGSDVNGYRSINISTNLEIEAQGEKYVYVTFELPKEKISEIIKDEFTFSSITEITSYSTSKDGKVYAGIDKNSNPGNAIPGKEKETYENDTDKAPDIRLAVATERTTKGTVFFDSTSGELRAGEERIGNGIFDNGEQTIDGVKV
ncbi:MAG: hypothetical protein HUJ68_01405, partial [Clostridia bacterium]|nr:hypothetical protein [Clostridia bacterium]